MAFASVQRQPEPLCICVRFTLEWQRKMKSERETERDGSWMDGGPEDGKVEGLGIEQRGRRGKEATPTYLSHETM